MHRDFFPCGVFKSDDSQNVINDNGLLLHTFILFRSLCIEESGHDFSIMTGVKE